ncbi:hypothetical protein OUZ56_022438 [Daphnia magna]|uniref:Uncharacterized protein n=1 Tax=Daphnia magna TaxID=35525 RepID=A0ABR0AWD6_9CRUS|nr:hypothetical protein OUZ56_022438 [Daphnia magna]
MFGMIEIFYWEFFIICLKLNSKFSSEITNMNSAVVNADFGGEKRLEARKDVYLLSLKFSKAILMVKY